MIDLSLIHFDAAGLIPAIVQEIDTNAVLLLASMNEVALRLTEETGEAHFWSRSRGKLWRKGESSGNRLLVERIALNCEANSLLLSVRLAGTGACHDGYHSCYYRAFNAAGQLDVIAPRLFDPALVYAEGDLERLLRELYAGYLRLRDEDFTAVSSTSRLFHDAAITSTWLLGRASEELDELRGVLAGTHVHQGGLDDVRLEASQVLYWLCLAAARSAMSFEDWQPHVALWQGWLAVQPAATDDPWQASLRQLGQSLQQAGVSPLVPVKADLEDLRRRLG